MNVEICASFGWQMSTSLNKQMYLMSFSIHFVKTDLYVYHLGPPSPSPPPLPPPHTPLLLKNVSPALQATLVSV